MIGYWLVQELHNAGLTRPVVAVITQTDVGAADPAFAIPTKVIGPVYSHAEAAQRAVRHGWTVSADGPVWRRLVPSPQARQILEQEPIARLVDAGTVVVCGGGGGVPITRDHTGRLPGIEAVIDKDLTAARLALGLAADRLLLLTDVPAVMRDFGTPRARPIHHLDLGQLAGLQRPAGSMDPKVEACRRFVEFTGDTAAIGALTDAAAILAGNAGATITPDLAVRLDRTRWAKTCMPSRLTVDRAPRLGKNEQMARDEYDTRASGRNEAGVPAAASTLSEEHSLLLREVTTRAEALLRETDEGRWPDQQLAALVDYLHLEVLQQVVDEERLVFLSHRGAEGLAGLRLAHRELRAAIDVLAQALAGEDTLTRQQVGDRTRNLITQLTDHLTAEEQVLATGDFQTPPTTTFGARPHEWYALTAGPVIDLDRLPGEAGFEAVLDRMLRLTPDEHVELRSSSDPDRIWRRIRAANPGGYDCEILQHGEGHWRVEISRRPAP